jgi:hypothetical protein
MEYKAEPIYTSWNSNRSDLETIMIPDNMKEANILAYYKLGLVILREQY